MLAQQHLHILYPAVTRVYYISTFVYCVTTMECMYHVISVSALCDHQSTCDYDITSQRVYIYIITTCDSCAYSMHVS